FGEVPEKTSFLLGRRFCSRKGFLQADSFCAWFLILNGVVCLPAYVLFPAGDEHRFQTDRADAGKECSHCFLPEKSVFLCPSWQRHAGNTRLPFRPAGQIPPAAAHRDVPVPETSAVCVQTAYHIPSRKNVCLKSENC